METEKKVYCESCKYVGWGGEYGMCGKACVTYKNETDRVRRTVSYGYRDSSTGNRGNHCKDWQAGFKAYKWLVAGIVFAGVMLITAFLVFGAMWFVCSPSTPPPHGGFYWALGKYVFLCGVPGASGLLIIFLSIKGMLARQGESENG